MPKSDLIPTAEAAAILGVDVRTVHRMVRRRSLPPATKLPGKTGSYVFARADVEALRAPAAERSAS